MKKLGIVIILVLSVNTIFGQSAIHVEKKGNGNPVILLPGFTSPGSVWNETINNIQGNYEFHLVSYAGFNGLEPISTPWYAPIKDQLIQYIKENKLKKLTLIGHSMGGSLAMNIAAELDEQVEGLILVDAIPCMIELMMPGTPPESMQYDSPYNKQMLQMNDEGFAQMAQMMCMNMTNDSTKVQTLVDWCIEADRKTYVYGFTDLMKLDLREQIKNIKTNTLIIGTCVPNKEIVQGNYNKQYANLQNKEFSLIENSKHFIMFDQPEYLNNEINKYLEKHVK